MKEKINKLPIKVAVRAIIVNDEQEVMLIKRALGTFEGDKWCLVGGKPDGNEDLTNAATRETQEEVGLQLPLIHYAEIENPDTSTGAKWITHYFVGNLNVLPSQLNPREVSEVAFFSQAELEKLDIAFDHKNVLLGFFESFQNK